MLTPCVLEGKTVRLEPLTEEILPELTRVCLSAPEIWTHIPYPMRDAADVAITLRTALALAARGEALPLATRSAASGELIGGTGIRVSDSRVPSVEVGGTWIVPRWQRTAVNTEAKLLQLTHCFERLRCQRVELKTDIRNTRSRAAILRLGAVQEGVLRSHMQRADGSLRDSVLFSIIAAEWPAVRERLARHLSSPREAVASSPREESRQEEDRR